MYRPTVRINSKTPTTFQELTTKEIERARRKKANDGRINKFKNNYCKIINETMYRLSSGERRYRFSLWIAFLQKIGQSKMYG